MFEFPFIALSIQDQKLTQVLIEAELAHEAKGKRFIPKNDQRFNNKIQTLTEGIRGELAVSRYLKISFSRELSKVDHFSGDLQFGIEVKATGKDNGNLYCSKKTHADYYARDKNTPIVLARVSNWPWVELPGWLTASEVVRFPFNRTDPRHNEGYLVHVSHLRPIEQLVDMVRHSQVKNLQAEV